jgi:hypothetical protein
MKRSSLLPALLFLTALPAWAELKLDTDVVEVKPKPEDETVQATFTFTNTGSKAVKAVGIESKCSCLEASLDAAVYEPGAKGTGKATFKVGSFVGRHEKFVVVQTDDPAQREWVITFVLDVPEVVGIEPRSVQWYVGDEAAPKDLVIKISGEQEIKVLRATAMRENAIDLSLKEIKPGREYTVKVTPKSTADIMLGGIKIETDSKILKYQRQVAFFSILRKPDRPAAP